MPRAGAYIVSELREGLTEIKCPKCGRFGRYRRETLLAQFGPDTPLPHVLRLIANCPRFGNMGDNCGAVYSEPLGRARPKPTQSGLVRRISHSRSEGRS